MGVLVDLTLPQAISNWGTIGAVQLLDLYSDAPLPQLPHRWVADYVGALFVRSTTSHLGHLRVPVPAKLLC